MAKQVMQKAIVIVTFYVCFALCLRSSHAQADAPTVYTDEVFVELAPGVIEEIAGDDVVIADPTKCFEAVGKVSDCIIDILKSLANGKLDIISPKCCEGFAAIKDDCWASVLPFDPSTLGIIKNICSRLAPPPTNAL
uniref:Prolamin-like domain-containing protein n=1 Tax=Kalanchoe fedtschenkoi TaxID=63787 RepID=A0A7N0TYM4_KALFE